MKKLQLLFVAFLLTGAVIAQVPQAINYQAVARNNAGVALANQTIKVRISIMKGASSLYSETRSVTTNALGLFNVQIGSAGALATTGNFTNFSWPNNSPDNKAIKVELDINNTNVFTDMGTQGLATVPYSFAAAEAINAINIGGNYVATSTPQLNNLLKWDGSAWTPSAPATYQPAIYSAAAAIGTIPAGNAGAPWLFTGGAQIITVTTGQIITANFVGSFKSANTSTSVPVSVAICYSAVPVGSPINPFQSTNYIDATVFPNSANTNTQLSATGAITLPAGSYRIGLGIKNKSASINLDQNDIVNGTIIVF